MISQHVLVGGGIVALCLMGLSKEHWLLENTKKGHRLVDRFGPAKAPWVFRALMAISLIFGGLLAAGIIRPVQW